MKPSALIARLRELATAALATSSPQQLAEHVAQAITAIADSLEDAQTFARAQMGQHLAELAPLLTAEDREKLQEIFGADLVLPDTAPSIEGLQVVEVPVATGDQVQPTTTDADVAADQVVWGLARRMHEACVDSFGTGEPALQLWDGLSSDLRDDWYCAAKKFQELSSAPL